MLEIVFTEKAEIDLNEIGAWYKSVREGLELEFLICVEAEMEILRKAPLVYRAHFDKVRKAIIDKFPCSIYYLIEETQITVLAIVHHKRSQKTISKKLKK